jgi:hypothetical protein
MFKQFSKTISKENVADYRIQKVQHGIAEIRPDSLVAVYKFRLSKSPLGVAYILVKQGSSVLDFLKSGQNLEIDYYPSSSIESGQTLKTKTSHIIKQLQRRFKGFHIVVYPPFKLLTNFIVGY